MKYFNFYISGERQNKNSCESKTKPTLLVSGHYVSSLLLSFPAAQRNLFGVILERFLSFQHGIGPLIRIPLWTLFVFLWALKSTDLAESPEANFVYHNIHNSIFTEQRQVTLLGHNFFLCLFWQFNIILFCWGFFSFLFTKQMLVFMRCNSCKNLA